MRASAARDSTGNRTTFAPFLGRKLDPATRRDGQTAFNVVSKAPRHQSTPWGRYREVYDTFGPFPAHRNTVNDLTFFTHYAR